jgi:hypothetical protein
MISAQTLRVCREGKPASTFPDDAQAGGAGCNSDLSIPSYLKQNPVMENQSDRPVGFQSLVQWATTRPQAYATYFVALILIGGLSFYAGTLKPKKVPAAPPPAVSVPRG